MGQGQEIIARNYLTAAIMDGQWLLLQNTHLGLTYLTEVCEEYLLHLDDMICKAPYSPEGGKTCVRTSHVRACLHCGIPVEHKAESPIRYS